MNREQWAVGIEQGSGIRDQGSGMRSSSSIGSSKLRAWTAVIPGRPLITHAAGVIIAHHGVTEEESLTCFASLRRESQEREGTSSSKHKSFHEGSVLFEPGGQCLPKQTAPAVPGSLASTTCRSSQKSIMSTPFKLPDEQTDVSRPVGAQRQDSFHEFVPVTRRMASIGWMHERTTETTL